jgi:hypothetical protein
MIPDNSLPNMKIQSITNCQSPITNYNGASGNISTTVERTLQIHLFLTNKANFRKSQVNVSNVLTRVYEKWTLGQVGKTNPKQTQNKANSNPIQSQFKANTNPNKPDFNRGFAKMGNHNWV